MHATTTPDDRQKIAILDIALWAMDFQIVESSRSEEAKFFFKLIDEVEVSQSDLSQLITQIWKVGVGSRK